MLTSRMVRSVSKQVLLLHTFDGEGMTGTLRSQAEGSVEFTTNHAISRRSLHSPPHRPPEER